MNLKELAPTWFEAFKRWDRFNFHEREAIKNDLWIESRCVVGEAWKWSADWECKECDFFAFGFCFVVNGPEHTLDRELLARKGKEFSKHWSKKHECLILTKNVSKKKNRERR